MFAYISIRHNNYYSIRLCRGGDSFYHFDKISYFYLVRKRYLDKNRRRHVAVEIRLVLTDRSIKATKLTNFLFQIMFLSVDEFIQLEDYPTIVQSTISLSNRYSYFN